MLCYSIVNNSGSRGSVTINNKSVTIPAFGRMITQDKPLSPTSNVQISMFYMQDEQKEPIRMIPNDSAKKSDPELEKELEEKTVKAAPDKPHKSGKKSDPELEKELEGIEIDNQDEVVSEETSENSL